MEESPIEKLQQTVARLRGPGGCAWDQEQTHESLTSCLIEECSEVLEAIDTSDFELMEEELGDLLLSILMHAQIASENGLFDFDGVAHHVNEKLIRRHPHVFGPKAGKMNTEEVLLQWEKIKAEEKASKGVQKIKLFKDLPPRLPALLHAKAIAKQFRKKGLSPNSLIDPKSIPDRKEEEVARELYELAVLCDQKKWDPEGLLRNYCEKVKTAAEADS